MSVASAIRRMAGSAIVGGALLASSAVVAHAQPSPLPFLGTGGNVFIRYVGSNSIVDRSILSYKIGNGVYNNGAYTDIVTNLAPGATAPGTEFNIGPVAAGTEVFFRLLNTTQAAYNINGNFLFSFYDGPAARNPFGSLHVSLSVGSGLAVTGGGGLTYQQGFNFEDRSSTIQPIADFDYNDLNFEIAGVNTTTPEPSSVALMLGGLLALGFAARRRRSV